MSKFIEPIDKAIEEFSKLPGIGKKSAMRIVYNLLNNGSLRIEELIEALRLLKDKIVMCEKCRGYKEVDKECLICFDEERDRKILCVVESTEDMFILNSSTDYRGVFFVLHGLLSLNKGKKLEDLGLESLKKLISENDVKEVVIALPFTAEGEATTGLIMKEIENMVEKISRIGIGIPMGSELSYIDPETIKKAFYFRRDIK